jgi:hypothetical protein
MSILFFGLTRCAICKEPLHEHEAVIGLPAFVYNEADVLWRFSDASLHQACLERHPLRHQVEEAVAELERRTGPGRRKCVVCRQEVMDPDDYLMVPRLTGERPMPAYRFNYTHLHRSHVKQWSELQALLDVLEDLERSGTWKGDALRRFREDLLLAAR